MIVGKDFPDLFAKDNFTLRRTTGHNMHDPESFITGAEISKGFTYTNSRRNWSDHSHYLQAVVGDISPEQIASTAPRVRIIPDTSPVNCGHVGIDRYCDACLDKFLESEMQ
jgi:hypothetical protein